MSPLAPYRDAHVDPQGVNDARPTALRIVQDQGLVNAWRGRVILVTGCTSGIGPETARALHATGADVYITGRKEEALKELVVKLEDEGLGEGKVGWFVMELDSLDSVRKGAAEFLEKSGGKLNVLVNNAGIMMCPESTTRDGFELQFGTCHLGHFLLFQLLKDALLKSSTPDFASRVVAVSSSGHLSGKIHFDDYNLKKGGYSPAKAYGQAKLANLYFANELDRRYGSRGLHALSLNPGGIATPLQRFMPPEFFTNFDTPEVRNILKSTEQGAATTVWAACAKEWEGKGGRYLEDVQEAEQMEDLQKWSGYAPHAYDEEAEKKLWIDSLKMVGVPDDQ